MTKKMNAHSFGAKLLSLVLLISVLSMMLAACGGEPDPLCGTWKASSLTAEGQTLNASEIFDEFVLVLEDGGSGTLTIDGETGDITWTNEEGTLTIIDDAGTEAVATANGEEELVFTNFGGVGADLYMARAN